MTTEEIIEGNRLIALFDGGVIEKQAPYYLEGFTHPDISHILWEGWYPESLEYHESWDWLMPVVDKIEELPRDDYHGKFVVIISSNTCTIQGSKLNTTPEYYRPAYFADYVLATKIESVWYACVRFVKWYSENKNNKNELV